MIATLQRVILVLTLAALLGAPVAVVGQEPPAEEVEPDRIIVAPYTYARGTSAAPSEAIDAVRQGSEDYTRDFHVDFVGVRQADVVAGIRAEPTYSEFVEVAGDWAKIGVTRFQQLDALGAAENLIRAVERYRDIGHDIVAPQEVASVLLYLALARIEQGSDVSGPLDVMREMIRLDPERNLERGAYPEEVVQFFESARLTVERDIREHGPDLSATKRLAERASARWVLTFAVLPSKTGHDLVSWLYDEEAGQFVESETLQLQSTTADALRDAANRLTSRQLACLLEPEPESIGPVQASSGESRWMVQLNAIYTSYLEFPDPGAADLHVFPNLGAAVGLGYLLTREFALMGLLQFATSLRDRNGEITDGFQSLRAFAGGELGIGFWRVRLAMGTFAEIATFSDVVLCPTPDYRDRFGDCADREQRIGLGTLAGFNLRPRASIELLRSMQLFAAGSASLYLLPFDAAAVNFPTTAEIGVQYRF